MTSRIGNKQRIAYSAQRTVPAERGGRLCSDIGFQGHGLPRYPSYTLPARKGLTLVEVLLAVSVLALGVVGVLRGYASSITVLEAAQHNIDAVNLLKMKMGELEVMVTAKEPIAPEITRGAFESPFEDFVWESAISPTDEEGLYMLALTVSSASNPRTFSLATYVVDKKAEETKEEE